MGGIIREFRSTQAASHRQKHTRESEVDKGKEKWPTVKTQHSDLDSNLIEVHWTDNDESKQEQNPP